MNRFHSVLFVFFRQYARDENLNGIRRRLPFPPLNVIRSRQFSLGQDSFLLIVVPHRTAASSVSHFSGFDVKYIDWAEQPAVGKSHSVTSDL